MTSVMVELEDYGEIWLYFSGQIYQTHFTKFRFAVSAEKPAMIVKFSATNVENLGSFCIDLSNNHNIEQQRIEIGHQRFEILGELSLQIVTLNDENYPRKLSGFSANIVPIQSSNSAPLEANYESTPGRSEESGPIFVQDRSIFFGIEDNGHFAQTVGQYEERQSSSTDLQEEKLLPPIKTLTQFLDRFLYHLYRQLPHAHVVETSTKQVTVKLGQTAVHHVNLEDIWRRNFLNNPRLDQDIVRCVSQLANIGENRVTHRNLNNVYISIHTVEQITEMAKALLSAKPLHQHSSSILARPLAANLQISYVFDYQNNQELVVESDLKQLKVTESELFRITIQNCCQRIKRIVCRETETPRLYQLWVDGTMDGSLLLLYEAWNQIDQLIDGNRVVCFPNRNLFLVTGSKNHAALQQMRKYSASYQGREQPVTQALLSWKNGQWEEFNLEHPPVTSSYSSKQKHQC